MALIQLEKTDDDQVGSATAVREQVRYTRHNRVAVLKKPCKSSAWARKFHIVRWVENPRVDGSIPSQATKHKNARSPEWAFCFVGTGTP